MADAGWRGSRSSPAPVAGLGWLVVPLVLLVVVITVVVRTPRDAPPAPAPSSPAAGPASTGPSTGASPGSSAAPVAGGPGLGDPYFPDDGNSGYQVTGYRLDLVWDAVGRALSGTTVITAVAAQPLVSFVVDFYLDPSEVVVDGRPARVERLDPLNLRIVPAAPLQGGAEFTVAVTYRGSPFSPHTPMPAAYVDGEEWLIAGEPGSAPYWFPSNDHPSDVATFELTLSVPTGVEVISVGRLVSRDADSDPATATWHWRLDQPVATYLTFVAVGQYQLDERAITAGGRELHGLFAVSEQVDDHEHVLSRLISDTEEAVAGLVDLFGAYPFDDIGGIVPVADVWFGGLETQTRPIYHRRSATSRVVGHELAHMWFGDQVTLREWNDIFNNEAYASYAEWLLAERSGGSADVIFDQWFASVKDDAAFWLVAPSDPGVAELFTVVYTRGPMALHALSEVIGRDLLLEISRDWAATPHVGSLELWRAYVQERTTVDLTGFFAAWLDAHQVPDQTAANGF